MAELPPGFRVVQQPSQQPSQLPEGFRVVDQEQANPYMTGGLGTVGQWNSGVNEGIANIFGLPVDVVNGAIGLGMQGANQAFGTDFQPSPEPFLGSQSIRGMMGGAILPESEDPQMQFVRRVGEEVGAALPVALATGGMSSAPAALIETELGLAGASGVGAASANQLFPDDANAELAGSLLGLGVGAAAPNALRRAVTPFPNDPMREALVSQLRDEGVALTAGQRTGNTPLRYAESELGQGTAQQFMDDQADAFTRAALSRAGISSNRATPEVLSQRYDELGNLFDDYARQTDIVIDQQLGDDVTEAVRSYADLVPEASQAPLITRTLNDLTDILNRGQDPVIQGTQYQSYRSRLGKAAQNASDPELRAALFDIQASLDDAAERTLSVTNPSLIEDWRQLRSDYRNFLILERAAGAAGENAAMGVISPAQLAGAVRGVAGRRAYAQGGNELASLARAGVGVMSSLPNSGTASRLAARGLPTALGAVMGGMSGDALATMGGALAGQAVPGVAGRTMLSGPGRAYLGNQALRPQQLPAGAMTSAGSAILANQEIDPMTYALLRYSAASQ